MSQRPEDKPARVLALWRAGFLDTAQIAYAVGLTEATVSHIIDSATGRQQPSPLPSPTSLTAALMGDPLPGRSAFDRRKP